ncbi:PTS sugar transporter subunit IIA [Methylobacterium segetis]|uniref:PTS sugar transporter subunit IIA n=1 Tax=Methylobacterium segetis TaxID=2488750 RepID=UPI00104DE417|nr:PTS sugar transporter subunit IIA [Methylobacterium segetis]
MAGEPPVPSDAASLGRILAPDGVLHGLRAAGKAALLGDLARRAARALPIDGAELLAALLRREDLGSTGVGDGVALPHARLEALARPFGILARLREPIAFDAIDEAPVDLVCLLLLPADAGGEHPNALACIARRLREPGIAAALRGARDAATLRAALCGRP